MTAPVYEPATCVVCGHADAREIASAEDVRREVELLWAYHTRRVRPDTPPARLMDRVAFSERPPWRLVECRECGLVYRNPTERAWELRALYIDDAPSERAMRALYDAQRGAARAQARVLRHVLGRGGTGLEIGSYVGAFLDAARAGGLSFEGVDINAHVNAFVRRLGFTVRDGELGAVPTSRTFDAIAIWNTFDQLADPRAVLADAWRRLRPGGVVVIRVPNGAFYARLRPSLFTGRRLARTAARAALAQNNLLSFPYRVGYAPASLTRFLRDAGFDVVRLRGDVLVPTADEWTRPWARAEERTVKRSMRIAARARLGWAPWFEAYARRRA